MLVVRSSQCARQRYIILNYLNVKKKCSISIFSSREIMQCQSIMNQCFVFHWNALFMDASCCITTRREISCFSCCFSLVFQNCLLRDQALHAQFKTLYCNAFKTSS